MWKQILQLFVTGALSVEDLQRLEIQYLELT